MSEQLENKENNNQSTTTVNPTPPQEKETKPDIPTKKRILPNRSKYVEFIRKQIDLGNVASIFVDFSKPIQDRIVEWHGKPDAVIFVGYPCMLSEKIKVTDPATGNEIITINYHLPKVFEDFDLIRLAYMPEYSCIAAVRDTHYEEEEI